MSSSRLSGLHVLVLEDEIWERKQLTAYLQSEKAVVHAAANLREARDILHAETIDFAVLDVRLPDGTGLDLFESSKALRDVPTVFVTSMDSVELAVQAMKAGAADYLVKPCPLEKLPYIHAAWTNRTRTRRRESWIEQEGLQEDEQLFHGAGWGVLQKDLKRLLNVEKRLEDSLPPILITGETGTGKSTLARYLHRKGPRAGRPFVEVNASHLSAQLAESELFGHEKGSFTDARERKIGLFEAADEGTLFLDEVTQLHPNVQAKLLTVLESGKIRRLGGLRPIGVDVRLIVATNANPEEAVRSGTFREDLYHRLSLVRLAIPALREVPDALPDLARHLLKRVSRRYHRPEAKLSANAIRRIRTHQWPGNIRELRHELERALIFSDSDEIDLPGLPEPWADPDQDESGLAWLNPEWRIPEEGFSLETAENTLIKMALKQSNQNISAAARLLGVPRHILRYRLQGKKS